MENLENITQNQEEKPSLESPSSEAKKKRILIVIIVLTILIIAAVVVSAIFLLNENNSALASQVRDVFIIFMALEILIVGIALVLLIIQLAILTNLLQNEVKPILKTTNETVNTLKGTVRFLSDNVTEPVIKLNQTLAMGKKLVDLIKPKRK
ncbi:MAG: hypothetical protein MUO40_02760 [Anaerolineaceae bacterium]|nr:hypothetical protein [Anaerolineaceae bacterium]